MSDKKPSFWREMIVGTALGASAIGGVEAQPPAGKEPPAKVRTVEEAPPPRRVDDKASSPDAAAEKKAVLHCMQIVRDCQLENGAIDLRTQWNPKSEEDQAVAKEAYDENKAAWEKAQAKVKRKDGEKAPEFPAFDPTKRDGIRVVPYFSNYMALGLMAGYEHHTKDIKDLERAAKWVAFCNKIQDPKTGIMHDHYGSRSQEKFYKSEDLDSVDAYASTNLQVIERYSRLVAKCDPMDKLKCEKIAPPADVLKAAKLSLKAIELCLKEDGLTVARPEVGEKAEYPVKFLMDNIEVYGGLVAGERYLRGAGATKEADRCKEIYTKIGVELKKYWQAEEKHFAWAIQDPAGERSFDTGLEDPYPHGMANQFGLAWVANGKEQKELWTKMQKDFKLDPKEHKVFDEAMPIARSYMISIALKDGNQEQWRKTLLKQMEEMPASRNGHIVGIAMLAAMEQGRWMDNILDGPVPAKKGPSK